MVEESVVVEVGEEQAAVKLVLVGPRGVKEEEAAVEVVLIGSGSIWLVSWDRLVLNPCVSGGMGLWVLTCYRGCLGVRGRGGFLVHCQSVDLAGLGYCFHL